MSIVFFCQNCGGRFEVADQAAGKQGRCKHCGQRMVVPQAGSLASSSATPHLGMSPPGRASAATAAATAGGSANAQAEAGGSNWLAQLTSQATLAPLTVERMPGLRKPAPRPSPLDDLGDSKPYALVEAPRRRSVAARASKPAGEVKVLWRTWLGTIQRAFRWINETAYLISVPFIMLIFMGAMMHSRPMALTGAAIVVLLNLGRVVSGLANIVVIPFRESPLQGILFLIPPITFFYMANNWKKLKRPTERVLGPLLTIALVVAAFMFIPSLSGKSLGANDLKGRLRSSVKDIGQSIESKAGRLKDVDVRSLATPPPTAPGAAPNGADEGPGLLHQLESKVQGAKQMIRNQADQIQQSAQPQ